MPADGVHERLYVFLIAFLCAYQPVPYYGISFYGYDTGLDVLLKAMAQLALVERRGVMCIEISVDCLLIYSKINGYPF